MINKLGLFVCLGCISGCVSGARSPDVSNVPSISFAEIGDSAVLAGAMEAFRKLHVPESQTLHVSFTRMRGGTSDYFQVLTEGVTQPAADSLKNAMFSVLRSQSPDAARLGLSLVLKSSDLSLRAVPSVRTPPELQNRKDVTAAVARAGAPFGTNATARLWILVGTAGIVERTRIETSSGIGALDTALEQAARVARFRPATLDRITVPTWIQLPFVVRVQ